MGSKEKSPFVLNEPGKDDDDESPLRFTRRKVQSTVGTNKLITTSSSPRRTVVRRPGLQPLGRSKGIREAEVDEDQKRETSTSLVADKEEGEWSDEEGSNNVKGENRNQEDSVLAPKRKEIRGPEATHALKLAANSGKQPKVDEQKETMLGKKRIRQTMFLNLSDVKQAGPAKIPTPRRPNFLPPTTTRIPKDSQPLLDSGETMKDAKQFDESNNEGNNNVESSDIKSECNNGDTDSGVTRFKRINNGANHAAEDKLLTDHRQSLLKQAVDSRQMKNGYAPIQKPPLSVQNNIDFKAVFKKLPSKKPMTVSTQYQDTSIERLLREVTNDKFWQHPEDAELQRVPGRFESVEEYVRVFEPLLFEECRAQLYSTWEELTETNSNSHTMVRIKNVERRERGWYDVILLPIHESRWHFKEGEVAVLSTPRPGTVRSKRPITEESEVSGRVAGTVRRHIPADTRDPIGAVLHFYVGDSYDSRSNVDDDHILDKLLPKGVWFLTVLGALATTQREYTALHAFRRLNSQMQSAILQPSPEQFPKYEEQVPSAPECFTENFAKHLHQTFNTPQLSAIHWAAMHTAAGTTNGLTKKQDPWPFTLVQGPPGTGKTHTVWGMLNVIHLVQYQHYYTALLKKLAPESYKQATESPENAPVGSIDQVLQNMDQNLFRTLHKLCPKPRMLVCAPSNAATDELLTRVLDRGFIDGEMKVYRPDVARVGVDTQTRAAQAVSVERRTEQLLVKSREEVYGWMHQLRAREAQLSQEIASLQRQLNVAAYTDYLTVERSDTSRWRSVETRDLDESPMGERWKGGYDDLEDNGNDKSRESKHHIKEKSRSSRRDEKDHRSRDREKSQISDASKERDKESKGSLKDSNRDRRKEDVDDREKERSRDKVREKENDREKYRDKDQIMDKDREREKELEKRDREKGTDKGKDRTREKERERNKEREKERETRGDRERERNRERDGDHDKDRSSDRDKASRKQPDEFHDGSKVLGKDAAYSDSEDGEFRDSSKHGTGSRHGRDEIKTSRNEANSEGEHGGSQQSASELQDRIMRMKEERLKKTSDGASDVLSWVSKSRKLEEKKKAEKEKALHFSKMFEERDNVTQEEDDDEPPARRHTSRDLAGFKVLDGLDKVVEGGAVVLTLKDQNILADGDINPEVDMLENVEIGEQKRRNEAYKAAKKKTGVYDDKFNEEAGFEKKMLPQYDDPIVNEGVTLDERGRFSGEAEKKLEELRRRIDGASVTSRFEDLTSTGKVSSDYYTSEEMLKFQKPKKKKSLRKKDKLDLEALEAEARSAGLGSGDRGSRADGKRLAQKEEHERSEAEKRNNAFQSAYMKADEASKALRMEQTLTVQKEVEEEEEFVFGDDDDDLHKSLQRARKVALKMKDETPSGPQAVALLASSTNKNADADNGESQDNKVVFTEMEEFVWGLQLDEEAHNPDSEDVFMEDDVAPAPSEQEQKVEDSGWAEVKDVIHDEKMADVEEEVKPDETIHESSLGKGLSGALQLLKDRGTLKDTVEWGGRNMDKKKSKLVGIVNENDDKKEIRIERTDEYGRILTPKESFRLLSHKFHGKGPGKMKQEKRMRQYHEELKVKRMNNADTPSQSVERMREAQLQTKSPYLVLSGHVKPGQTSDPRSGFATMENFPGSLTPMLGDRKVENFLGIKRKSESGNMGPPKKPKT